MNTKKMISLLLVLLSLCAPALALADTWVDGWLVPDSIAASGAGTYTPPAQVMNVGPATPSTTTGQVMFVGPASSSQVDYYNPSGYYSPSTYYSSYSNYTPSYYNTLADRYAQALYEASRVTLPNGDVIHPSYVHDVWGNTHLTSGYYWPYTSVNPNWTTSQTARYLESVANQYINRQVWSNNSFNSFNWK